MRTSIVHFFLCLPYRDGAAHDDRLHLPAWLCDHGVSRHAHRVARSPSSPALLAHLHASRLSWAQNLGRDGQVDAQPPSPPGALGACSKRPIGTCICSSAGWRRISWPPCRHPPMACCICLAMAATPTNAAPRILWRRQGRISQHHPWFFGLRFVLLMAAWDGYRVPVGFRLIVAQAPCRLSQRKCLVSRDGGRVCPTTVGQSW